MNRFSKCIKLAGITGGENILDLGCGDMKLKKYLPSNCKYIGIDYNGKGNIKHNLEKGLPLEIKDGKFDVIFMLEFIEHIENFKSLLLECREILSSKGRVIISTPHNHRLLISDFTTKWIGEDKTHIHCFRKSSMLNLAHICGYKITKMIGTGIRFPPFTRKYFFVIPTNQTIYGEGIIYRLEKI